MYSVASLAAGARNMLRDFPKFFEISEGPLNVLTIRLPHPCVSAASLQVYVVDDTAQPPTSTPTKAWTCDERNGLLKLDDEAMMGKTIVVAGYHYVWFTDSDLTAAAQIQASEMLYGGTPNDDVSDMTDVMAEVTMMGTVMRALWSLSIELALDIDVSTPEGMYIPAHQRYAQVVQQMQYWESQYEERAASLNMGLGALEQFRLRRVALTTGRYVPVYKDREFDDPRYPERLYPPIPEGVPEGTETPTWAKVAEIERARGYGVSYPAISFPAVFGADREVLDVE